jgi:hypothetical protein
LSVAVLGALVGVAGSFVLTYVRDIYLHSKRAREQRRLAIVERQLEKVYSPLYRFIETFQALTGQRALGIQGSFFAAQSPDKILFDSIIANYLYLADPDLAGILPRLHGVGFYQPQNQQAITDVVTLITNGYERLRKEYFAVNG